MQTILEKAKTVTLLAMDVDGVLTNGSLYFGNSGEEMKAFSILDGLGIKLLRDAGIRPPSSPAEPLNCCCDAREN